MPVVNTCVNEVNHRLIVSRLPGRLGEFPAGGVTGWLEGWEKAGLGDGLWERPERQCGPLLAVHFQSCLDPEQCQGTRERCRSLLCLEKGAKSANGSKGALCLSSRDFLRNLTLRVIEGISADSKRLA